jgi:hypothetical protein
MPEFSIVAQIAEVEREIAMRYKVYPNWVANAKMKQSEADYYMGRMQAVLKTLQWLQKNESRIKEKTRPENPDGVVADHRNG